MDADVAIVGAGIAGALIATRLAAAGIKVVVLEAGPRVARGDAVTQFMSRLSTGSPTCWRTSVVGGGSGGRGTTAADWSSDAP